MTRDGTRTRSAKQRTRDLRVNRKFKQDLRRGQS